MAGIFSDVSTDIQKLRQLKAEIENVKKSLKGIDVNVNVDIAKGMKAQLQSLMKQYDTLVKKVSEAEGKIIISTKRINDASEKIIKAQEQLSKAAGMNTQPSNGNADVSLNNMGTTSVRAQAKAYNELAEEIDSVMGTRSQNIKRMIDEQNAIRLINEEIKRLTKLQIGNSTLTSTQQKRLEQLNNSLLTHKAALSEVRQTLMNNVRLDNAATTSMNGLSQSLSRMRIAYRELTEEERNSPFGKELLASIQQADAKIKELDATIGNHQRNVGNYAKGYNGLNMSVQQIVRELPSAAMGLNTFFLAISNNLPILTDEIKRAKTANEELKTSGQSTIPIWKQLVTSFFSWQSAMMIGITLLTVYGKDISNWVAEMFKSKDALKDVRKAQEEFNAYISKLNEDWRNSVATAAGENIAAYQRLAREYNALGDNMNAKKKFITDNQDAFHELGFSVNGVTDAENLFVRNTDAVVNALVARAKAAAYEQEITDATQRYIKQTEYNNSTVSGGGYYKTIHAGQNWTSTGIVPEELRNLKKGVDYTTISSQTVVSFTLTAAGAARINAQRSREAADRLKKNNEEAKRQLDSVVSRATEGIRQQTDAEQAVYNSLGIKSYAPQSSSTNDKKKTISEISLSENLLNLQRKQAIERAKEAEELESQVEQARINAMADGSDKIIAQREYDNKKELEAIDRAKEEYIQKEIQRQKEIFDAREELKAKQNPKYKRRSFDSSNVMVDSSSYDLLKEYTEKSQIQNEINAQRDALNEYLKNYGTYQQKRLAISQEYSDKINKAQSEGERLSLQASMDDALSKLDFEQMKEKMNWEDVFGNLGDMTISQLERIRQQLRNMLSDGDLGLEEYKTAVEQIDKINTAIVEKNDEVKNTLGLILPMTQRRKEIEMEVAEAERTVNSLMHEMMEMQNSLNQQRESVAGYLQLSGISVGAKDIITSNFDNILSQIGGLFGEDSDIYKNVQKSFDNIAVSERKLTNTTQKLVGAQNNEYGARTKLNNFLTNFGNKLQAVSDIMSLIGSNIQSLPDLFSQLGIDMSGDFGKGINDLANASQSASNFIKDAMSGNFVGALSNGIGAVRGVLSGFNNIFGFGIGKGNAEYVTELTEKLTDSNDRLRDSIDRLKDKIDESAGGEAIKNYEQAKDAQEQLNRQTLEILKAQMSYTGAHHSNAYYWGEAIDGNAATSSRIYGSINKSLIEWLKTNPDASYNINSVNSYEDIFKLTPEQMAYIRDYNREIWDEITDIGKYDKSEYWEKYADLAGQIENLTEQINENLTQVSFDSLRDSFMNTLLDMNADAQDFADDFGEYMMKSLLNYQLGDIFDEDLKKWYDDWAQMMNGQKGNLTDTQMNELKDRWENMVDEALSLRDSIADITGYTGGSEEQQSASSKGFETMSQDTANELNGRFTALYESNLRIETAEQQQTVAITELKGNISALTAQAVGIYNIADETRTILANSYLELQEIRENTGYSAKYLKDIKSDIAEVKRNTSRL